MKTSIISQLLIVFYFITLTGCIECDDNGNGCLSIEGSIISSNARAPDYNSTSFIGHLPGVIKLTPLGE